MLKKWLLLTLAVLILGSVTAGVAVAAANPQTAENPGEVFLNKLAGALGIDRATLDDAIKTVNNQMVDQALQDGKITEQQADEMRSRISQGIPFFGIMGMRHGGGMVKGGFMGLQPLADALGMTPQEIKTALDGGKTISDLATEKGMTIEQVQAQILAKTKARLDQEVQDGKLTQSRADEMYSKLEQRINSGDWIDQLQKRCQAKGRQ